MGPNRCGIPATGSSSRIRTGRGSRCSAASSRRCMSEPVELEGDERICLNIAFHGQLMLAIGRWEGPIKSLSRKGLMRKSGHGYAITDKGRELWRDIEEGL